MKHGHSSVSVLSAGRPSKFSIFCRRRPRGRLASLSAGVSDSQPVSFRFFDALSYVNMTLVTAQLLCVNIDRAVQHLDGRAAPDDSSLIDKTDGK